MTPEGKVKADIDKYLKSLARCTFKKPVSIGYGKSGVDYDICIRGLYVALEVKAKEGMKATPREEKYLEDVRKAGGIGLTVGSVEELKMHFRYLYLEEGVK